jgi:uncharacterized Zn-binding protein involved in type VI secretion
MGQPCAVKTSSTTHGGTPVTSAATTKAGGSLIIRITDTISCPIHGSTTITSGSGTVITEGMGTAFNGSSTSCGATIINGVATVLIGS